MGLFSRVRRVNGSARPPETTSAPAPQGDAAPPLEAAPRAEAGPGSEPPRLAASSLSSLRDGLQQLYSIRPSREAFAEEAVKLIAKSSGVRAAALLGYEQRGGRLQLLAHAGLDAEAAQILSGDSVVSAWDIPLRSLRNRRINVIEAAHENPFVPKPLVALSPRRLTIAALPFFHANAPVGVAVLFSPTPRGFADGLLKTLSQALRVCALALSELPAAGTGVERLAEEESAGVQPSLLRGLAALKAELARLTVALEEAERQRAAEAAERVTAQSFLGAARERAAQLEQELAEQRGASARVPNLEERIDGLSRRLAAATEAADAAQTQVAQLQAAIVAGEQRAARDAAAIADLTSRRTELEQQLQSALGAARQHGEEVDALRAQIAEFAALAAQGAELQAALTVADTAAKKAEAVVAHLRQELEAVQEQRARTSAALEQTSAALSASEADRSALAIRTQQDLAALRERLNRVESERAAREQELEAARAALGAGGQALAASAERAAARIGELEAERTRLGGELDRSRAQAGEAAAELQRLGAAAETLRYERDSARSTLAQVESEQSRLGDRLAALQREVEAAHATGAGLEAQLAEQREAAGRDAAERRELLGRIDALAAGGQSLEQERRAAVGAAHQRVAELEAEIGRLTAGLDAARGQAAAELDRTRRDAGTTLEQLRADLAEAVRARNELQHALGAAQQEAAARIGALEADLRTVREQQLAAAVAQLAAEREAHQAAQAAHAAAEARHQAEIVELRQRQAAFEGEQARLAKELEAKDLLLQSAEQGLTAAIDLSAEAADDDSVLDIDRDYAPQAATGAGPEVLAEVDAAAGSDCILLDAEEIGGAAARQLAQFGHRVSTLTPTPEVSQLLKERTVACAAVNLAAPNAWALLRHMRNGSGIPRMPLIAYALVANAPKGFWLGPVDFALLPVAQVDLADLLGRLAPNAKRVLAMSNDIDVMSDVRTQLTRAGISTAVVLDGRQALDLVPTIRPEAAVLHLSPSCADVFRAIAGLRSAEISRDIPILFLLDAEAQPREEAFLTAGLRMLSGRGDLVPDGLVDSLASAFGVYRSM